MSFELFENVSGELVSEYKTESEALKAVLAYGYQSTGLESEGFTLVEVNGDDAQILASGTFLARLAVEKHGPNPVHAPEEMAKIRVQQAEMNRATTPDEKPKARRGRPPKVKAKVEEEFQRLPVTAGFPSEPSPLGKTAHTRCPCESLRRRF